MECTKGASWIAPSLYDPVVQLQRTFFQDIEWIGEILSATALQDELTKDLRLWHDKFKEVMGLQTVDKEMVLKTKLDDLQKILVNPYEFPLDEESMLGSDGFVYSRKFLCNHIYNTEPQYKQRSPIRLDDQTPFSVVPHEPARALVRWLKRYRPDFHSDLVEQVYNKIPIDQIPLIPSGQIEPKETKSNGLNEWLRRIRDERAERGHIADIRDRALRGPQVSITAMFDRVFVPRFSQLDKMVEDNDAELNQRLDAFEQCFHLFVEDLKEEFNQIDLEIETLDQDINWLQAQTKENGEGVESAKNDNIRLETSMKETEKAIKKRKKRWIKEVLVAVAAIGASAAASWAITAIINSMGTTSASAGISAAGNTIKGFLTVKW